MSNFINDRHARIFENTSRIPGPQTPGDAEKLYELGYRFGDVILEVGTYHGRSAVEMLQGALANPERRKPPQYFGIDISGVAMSETLKTLKAHGLAQFALLFRGDLQSFAAKVGIAPTMAFIDGDHTYDGLSADTAALAVLLRPGTPVLFHDYLNAENEASGLGVRRAVDEWASAGFATIEETPGVSCLVTTTDKCSGSGRAICSDDFSRIQRRHDGLGFAARLQRSVAHRLRLPLHSAIRSP